jgi:hypothetical protein
LQAAHNDFFRLVPELEKAARGLGLVDEKWQERTEFAGYVSGTEVTHGERGWHPHRHYIFSFRASKSANELAELGAYLAPHWRDCVIRHLGEDCAPTVERGLDIRALKIADYLSKMGLEISDVGVKEAKGGNATPWGLLSRMSEGEGAAHEAFSEYAVAMKGAKCVQFSERLKALWERLGAKPQTEAELADETRGAAVVFELTRAQWFRLRCSGRVRDFLQRCNGGELPAYCEPTGPPGWGDQERAIDYAEHGGPIMPTAAARRAQSAAALQNYFAMVRREAARNLEKVGGDFFKA